MAFDGCSGAPAGSGWGSYGPTPGEDSAPVKAMHLIMRGAPREMRLRPYDALSAALLHLYEEVRSENAKLKGARSLHMGRRSQRLIEFSSPICSQL